MQCLPRSHGTTRHGHCHGHAGHGQLDAGGVLHKVCGAVCVQVGYVCMYVLQTVCMCYVHTVCMCYKLYVCAMYILYVCAMYILYVCAMYILYVCAMYVCMCYILYVCATYCMYVLRTYVWEPADEAVCSTADLCKDGT